MNTVPDTPEAPPSKPRHGCLPIVLSSVVFPGAGQFSQKRYIAGTFYAVFFAAAFILFIVKLILLYARVIDDALNGMSGPGLGPDSGRSILLAALGAIAVYLLNLIDVWAAQLRRRRRARR